MRLVSIFCTIMLAAACTSAACAQKAEHAPAKSSPDITKSSTAITNPATAAQVREYLRISGEVDEFRKSWIAAVDKNRSIGEPYWPESFFQAVKDEMQKTDLVPMYVAFFQRGVSRELMQEVLDAYHERGREQFRGSPECLKLGAALAGAQGEMERLKLSETQAVFDKVYAEYKPQIKAARARYLADHPDWKKK